MALIDKETIRKEIERRKGYISVTHFAEELLDFLDSLPEKPKLKPMNIPSAGGAMGTTPPSYKLDVKPEQPVKGLEVTDFCKPVDPDIAKCVADHWWEMLGEESTNKKPVEGLEEEIRRWIHAQRNNGRKLFGWIDMVELAARHFAEWGAEHLKTIKK